MKKTKKLLALGIVSVVIATSTPVFAKTNSSTSSNGNSQVVTQNATKGISVKTNVANVPTIPNKAKASFNYGPDGGPDAWSIIENGSVIQKGDVGRAVKDVQRLLRSNGYLVNVDGYFGDDTERAVVGYQNLHLNYPGKLVPDGIVGSQTLGALSYV